MPLRQGFALDQPSTDLEHIADCALCERSDLPHVPVKFLERLRVEPVFVGYAHQRALSVAGGRLLR
jgi:hypothetical protein